MVITSRTSPDVVIFHTKIGKSVSSVSSNILIFVKVMDKNPSSDSSDTPKGAISELSGGGGQSFLLILLSTSENVLIQFYSHE